MVRYCGVLTMDRARQIRALLGEFPGCWTAKCFLLYALQAKSRVSYKPSIFKSLCNAPARKSHLFNHLSNLRGEGGRYLFLKSKRMVLSHPGSALATRHFSWELMALLQGISLRGAVRASNDSG